LLKEKPNFPKVFYSQIETTNIFHHFIKALKLKPYFGFSIVHFLFILGLIIKEVSNFFQFICSTFLLFIKVVV
jgi:hypothetical protein